jgi:hypothetical protein
MEPASQQTKNPSHGTKCRVSDNKRQNTPVETYSGQDISVSIKLSNKVDLPFASQPSPLLASPDLKRLSRLSPVLGGYILETWQGLIPAVDKMLPMGTFGAHIQITFHM